MTGKPYIEGYLIEKEAKAQRRQIFSRVGWSIFILVAVWFGFLTLVGLAVGALELLALPAMGFYDRYMMLFNELGLAIGMAFGLLALKGVPESCPPVGKVGAGRFLKWASVGMAIGAIGNLIASGLLALWNAWTGNEAGGEVEELILGSSGVVLFLSVGVLAPILEELFFRKFLIDRTRRFGEKTAIVFSAVMFGLFHGNVTQFFYAAGLGALLAYVYLKSGSIMTAILLHAFFNVFAGLLPAYLMTNANETLYMVYVVVYIMLIVLGCIFALPALPDLKIGRGEGILTRKKAFAASVWNGGMIAALFVLAVILVFSLFSS